MIGTKLNLSDKQKNNKKTKMNQTNKLGDKKLIKTLLQNDETKFIK